MSLTGTGFKFPLIEATDTAGIEEKFSRPEERSISPAPTYMERDACKLPHTIKSYRLRPGQEYPKPWLEDLRWNQGKRRNDIIMLTGFGFALLLIAFELYMGYQMATPPGKYCLIMDDRFESIDAGNWGYEIQTGGFRRGQFDWTTSDPKNAFVDTEGLHIVPTLTTESTNITGTQLLDGYSLNITDTGGNGSCTSSDMTMCSIRSNHTLGHILPPVRSARLTTKGKKSIKYGRVEVVAKMPKGDWLWPAIWMLPEDSVYGGWPASGEIDIAESRGNDESYPRGRNLITSTLHWGPDPQRDAYDTTYDTKFFWRTDFSQDFRTFGLEWTEGYIFMYIGNRLNTVFSMNFKDEEPFWVKGDFEGTATGNRTLVRNPWAKAGNAVAPFDQKFYLILNVAVGAQNGWFYDGRYDKPWIDGSESAARDFWNAKDQWLPTWGNGTDRGMTVKSVKMWQQC